MESVTDAIKVVSDYGLSIILSAIVVYVVIRLIHIGFVRLESNARRQDHDNALEIRQEVDEEVYSILNNFIEAHDGLRLQVVEFTNTVTSVAYLPFRYMSCTYEVVSYGEKREARCIDKLSTSLFSPFLSKLGKEEYLVLNDEETDDLSGVLHDLNQEIGGRYFLTVMMKSAKDKCIGYVGFYKNKEVEQKDIDDLLLIGSKISALLGVLD